MSHVLHVQCFSFPTAFHKVPVDSLIFWEGFCSRCSSLASWGLMGVVEMTAVLLRRQCFVFFSVTLHIVLTEANKASCLAALHQTSCDKRFDIVFLELVLLCFAENQGIKFDANLVRSLLGSRPELRTGVDLFRHRGRFLNRLVESGDTCYKYMGCASGLAAGSVIHGGEGLVGPYCGGWQLNAMGLEESRPDTLQSTGDLTEQQAEGEPHRFLAAEGDQVCGDAIHKARGVVGQLQQSTVPHGG